MINDFIMIQEKSGTRHEKGNSRPQALRAFNVEKRALGALQACLSKERFAESENFYVSEADREGK
jgi:hypothetical protein